MAECEAINAICWNCRKRGHFASVCKQRMVYEVVNTPPVSMKDFPEFNICRGTFFWIDQPKPGEDNGIIEDRVEFTNILVNNQKSGLL